MRCVVLAVATLSIVPACGSSGEADGGRIANRADAASDASSGDGPAADGVAPDARAPDGAATTDAAVEASPNVCGNGGAPCVENVECCAGDVTGGACVFDGFALVCAPRCAVGTDCATGCCRASVCVAAAHCQPMSCYPLGYACASNGECCGTGSGDAACVDATGSGQGFCTSVCDDDAGCPAGCCLRSGGGVSVCVPQHRCGDGG